MRLTLMAALLLLCGCSVYLPLDPDVPPPAGTNVRARLTTPGAVRISDRLGSPVREIEGEVLGFWGDSLGLNLMSTTEYGRPWDSVDTLKLATMEVFEFDEKRLDMKRTAFLVGGVGRHHGSGPEIHLQRRRGIGWWRWARGCRRDCHSFLFHSSLIRRIAV